MGDHVDNRKHGPKRKQRSITRENVDAGTNRAARVSFKSYLRALEEELLEEELEELDIGNEDDLPNK